MIYARKHVDSPDLKFFFGFSDLLYNLVHDCWGIFENISPQERENLSSSWETYQQSGAFSQDITHLIFQTLSSSGFRVFSVLFFGSLLFAECKLCLFDCLYVYLSIYLSNYLSFLTSVFKPHRSHYDNLVSLSLPLSFYLAFSFFLLYINILPQDGFYCLLSKLLHPWLSLAMRKIRSQMGATEEKKGGYLLWLFMVFIAKVSSF